MGQNVDMAIYRQPSSCHMRIDTLALNVDMYIFSQEFLFHFYAMKNYI